MSKAATAKKASGKSAQAARPRLLTGGNPQIAKANGDASDTRYLDICEDDQLDEAQLAAWVKQASRLPGWRAA